MNNSYLLVMSLRMKVSFLNVHTVSFFGHRELGDSLLVEQCLDKLIQKLIREKEYVEFLVGREGEFDQLVSSTIRRCKRLVRDDNSALSCRYPQSQTARCRTGYWQQP